MGSSPRRDEIATSLACGAISDVIFALSREPGQPRRYVQEAIVAVRGLQENKDQE